MPLPPLEAIDLSGLTTQSAIDAAETAIAGLKAALEAATELSDADKAAALVQLATASRTVLLAKDRVDIADQMVALSTAHTALEAIDLDNLMTQAQIDVANAAVVALDLALEDATGLTAAQKLDATVAVTLARRRVMAAQTTLDTNIETQRTALTTAHDALSKIDTDDLDTQAKIDAAQDAINALRAALEGATHLSDAEKEASQTLLEGDTEKVKTARTGMDSTERMAAQRTAITNAVTAARTAVNGVDNDSTDTEVGAADSAIAALKKAIADAEDLPEGDTDVAVAEGTLATLEGLLTAAKTRRTAYMTAKSEMSDEDMAKLGRALHAALGASGGVGDPAERAGERHICPVGRRQDSRLLPLMEQGQFPTAQPHLSRFSRPAIPSRRWVPGWDGTTSTRTPAPR